MGCCTSTSASAKASSSSHPTSVSKRILVTCSYNTDSETFSTTNLSSIRDGLRKRFPGLVFKSFRLMLDKKEITSAEDIRQEADAKGNKVTLTVEIESNVNLGPAWEPVTRRVFILAQGEVVAGTGFLLSPELALCTADNLEATLRKGEFTCVFPGRSEQKDKLKQDGLCLRLVTQETGETCVVQLMQPKEGVAGSRMQDCYPKEDARVFFINIISPLTPETESTYLSETILREGATGAPVFSASQEFLGIYAAVSKNHAGLVLSVSSLIGKLTTLVGSLKDKEKDAVLAILPEWKATEEVYTAPVVSKQENAAPEPNISENFHSDPPVEPEQVQVQVSDLEPEAKFECAEPFFAISLKENSVIQYATEGERIRTVPCPVFLTSGYNAVMTPKGLFITACDSNEQMTAILLSDTLKILHGPVWIHQFHCGAWFNNKLMVISGLSTDSLESYSFEENYWSQGPNLPKARAKSSAVVHREAVFVFGGMGRYLRRYKKSVFCFNGDEWVKLPHSLPLQLRNCGALILNDSILVFGGVKKAKDDSISNESLIELDLTTGSLRDVGKQDLGLFGGFTTSEVAGKLIAANDDGRVFEFQRSIKKFRIVHQGAN